MRKGVLIKLKLIAKKREALEYQKGAEINDENFLTLLFNERKLNVRWWTFGTPQSQVKAKQLKKERWRWKIKRKEEKTGSWNERRGERRKKPE